MSPSLAYLLKLFASLFTSCLASHTLWHPSKDLAAPPGAPATLIENHCLHGKIEYFVTETENRGAMKKVMDKTAA